MQLKQMTDQLANDEREHGSRQHVLNEFLRRQAGYDDALQQVKNSQRSLNRMLNMARIRKEFIETFRRSIATQSRYVFQSLLKSRNFEGQLVFDFKERTLDLLVTPLGRNSVRVAEGPASKRCRVGHGDDIRTLSGGERSLATVCLILSLWEAIDSPLRILDEFDVFMVKTKRFLLFS